MNQTVVGSPYPILQTEETSYDFQRGFIYRQHWEGTSQPLMLALMQDYVNAGISCRIRYELGKGILEIDDSTKEWTLDTWQLDGQSAQISWLSNPFILQEINFQYPAVVDGKTYTVSDAMAALAQNFSEGTSQASAFAVNTVLDPLIGSQIYYFYPYAANGDNTTYENDADGTGYVLRHGTNVSNQYQSNIADFGTGQIYTTAQLLSEVSDSGLWINPLSERLQYKIANLVSPPPLAHFTIGWKKSRSNENYSANNRNEIVTLYKYGQWAFALYDNFQGSPFGP